MFKIVTIPLAIVYIQVVSVLIFKRFHSGRQLRTEKQWGLQRRLHSALHCSTPALNKGRDQNRRGDRFIERIPHDRKQFVNLFIFAISFTRNMNPAWQALNGSRSTREQHAVSTRFGQNGARCTFYKQYL